MNMFSDINDDRNEIIPSWFSWKEHCRVSTCSFELFLSKFSAEFGLHAKLDGRRYYTIHKNPKVTES
jgi:hypothetical protein